MVTDRSKKVDRFLTKLGRNKKILSNDLSTQDYKIPEREPLSYVEMHFNV